MMRKTLPKGWSELELSHCVDILDNKRIPVNSKDRSERVGEVPYYGATGRVGWIDDYIFNEELLLLGEDGAPFYDKSKPIAYIIDGKSWVNNHAHVLRALCDITSNQYLKYFLDYFDFNGYVTGTTRLKLNQGSMKKIPVKLAPLSEQHRIVEKLDDLLGKVDACKKRLDRIPLILKRFRQSILAAACSGRLTEDWREQNRVLDDWQINILSDIAYLRLGKMLDKSKNIGQPTQYLRNVNVRWFEFDLSDLYEMKATPKDKEILDVRDGDLFICEGGEPGRCAVWNNGNNDLIFQKALHRARPQTDTSPYWIALNIYNDANSGKLSEYFTGSTIKHLTGKKLAVYKLNLPTLAEQKEIVQRVETLFRFADQIEARYEKAKGYVDKLTQSILAKAFRGELVSQNTRDEPASTTLKHVCLRSTEKPK